MIGDDRVDQVVKQQIYESSHSEDDGELLMHSDCWKQLFLPESHVMTGEDATLCVVRHECYILCHTL